MRRLIARRGLLAKTALFVAVVLLAKYGMHVLGWEFIELNALFTAIISANVFLLGFLLAGVLTDFKESERLPGEISVSIDAISDEALVLYSSKQVPAARKCLEYLMSFVGTLKRWFHKQERTRTVLQELRGLGAFFKAFEEHLPANFVVRLKQEQSILRRLVLRIDTIRDTSFVVSGYRVAQINSIFLILGLIFVELNPFSNALFFTTIISFLFIYMLALIHDIDNPFGFYTELHGENVSLSLLDDLEDRLKEELNNLPR